MLHDKVILKQYNWEAFLDEPFIYENCIGDAIADVPAINTRLKVIYLGEYFGDNRDRDRDIVDIAAALSKNTMLKDLSLYYIKDDGAVAIAKSLAKNTTLKGLNLGDKIGDIGAVAIAKSLTENTTLQALTLDFNKIGDIGADAIAKSLAKNTVLTHLSFKCNRASYKIATKIKIQLFRRNLRLMIRTNSLTSIIGVKEYVEMGDSAVIARQHLNLSPLDLRTTLQLIGHCHRVKVTVTAVLTVCKAWRNLLG